MKIDEAIEILKEIYPSKSQIGKGEYDHVAEALDMAIEAIKMVDQIKVECEFAKKYERGRCKTFANHLLYVIEMGVEEDARLVMQKD